MSVTRYVGIDPGKSGAIAAIDAATGQVDLQLTPTLPAGKGSKVEYSLTEICHALRLHIHEAGGINRIFVTVEKSQPLPSIRGSDGKQMGGSLANFNRGMSCGWQWMLVALGVAHQLVAPRTWQSVMHLGTSGENTKQKSIMAAQRLFPSVSLRRTARCSTEHDGLAEALLIAEFGRRALKGELPAPAKKSKAKAAAGDLFAEGTP